MMTVSRLSAGDGYDYYTSVTARGDIDKTASELGDYYLEPGTPRGEWIGGGAAELGISGEVAEEQMRALFGEGLHPNATQLIEQHIKAGATPKQAIERVRLGRKFARYDTPDNELRASIRTATDAFERANDRATTPDELLRIRMTQAGILFRERHGRTGSSPEVAKFLAAELGKGQNAVAGFDLTFSAPKSLSVAWAVADPEHAAALENAHTRAIEATIKWLETEVIRARTGAQGITQRDTRGLLGTRFRHWESREGDPQLHDHVVIANRVQISDGSRTKWLTIDSRTLYHATINASSVYNRHLADELKTLGIELRQRASGRHTGMELACISDRQIARFSSRTAAVEARTKQLVDDYVATHGRQPGTKALLHLKQRATLETRVPKSQAVNRSGLRARWRAQLGQETDTIRANLAAELDRKHAVEPAQPVDVARVAGDIIEGISAKQSTWNHNHVETRVNMWAAAQPQVVRAEIRAAITAHALDKASISITPAPAVPFHHELVNADGTSIYTSRHQQFFTSRAVLDAEDLLVYTAQEIALPSITHEHFQAALDAHDGPIDEGQIALARDFACSERLLSVGIGPAGTGKTTALNLAVQAAREAGATTHGLSVSAAAAAQLQQSTGMESTTIAKWLRDLEAGSRQLGAGHIVIVDEAGMASARDLAAIINHALTTGAFVRLVGDDRQLQAIGAGGALKMLTAEVGAVHLDQVHRFLDSAEAHASLRLREHGDVAWYLSRGRVHGGTAAGVYTRVVDAWAADERDGKTSLIMASTNDAVATLNQLAQDDRVAAGAVTLDRTTALADGAHAGVGDRIVTRRNNRQLTTTRGHGFVKNGDLWTITRIHDDGSVTAHDRHRRRVTLPAAYLQESVGLGYASTVHRAQGQTVDVARLIIDDRTSREALYVGLTRGRQLNEVHAITDGRSAGELLHRAAANVTQATSARELIHQAQDQASHPATLSRILSDMQQRADRHRYAAALRQVLPQHAETILASDRHQQLVHALTQANDQGFDTQRILRLTTIDLPTLPGDLTGLITWRINQHLKLAAAHARNNQHRPLRDLPGHRLDQLLAHATHDKHAAREALAHTIRPVQLRDGSRASDWSARPHGHLTDTQLADLLHAARNRATLISRAISETQRHARDLTHEIRTNTSPDLTDALMRRRDRLRNRIDRLRDDRRDALTTGAQLQQESSLRARLTPADWTRKQQQRTNPSPWAMPDQLTRQLVGRATTLQRELWLEQRARQFDPDHSPQDRMSPVWAIPARGLTDPNMPASWHLPLAEMRATVTAAIEHHGAALAAEPPVWATRYLGPVPAVDSPHRARWELLAGQIDTLRALTDHTDLDKALPTPRQAHALGPDAATHLHNLHTAASDLRLGRIQPTPTKTIDEPTIIINHVTEPPNSSSTPAVALLPTKLPDLATKRELSDSIGQLRRNLAWRDLGQRLHARVDAQRTIKTLDTQLTALLHEPLTATNPATAERLEQIGALLVQRGHAQALGGLPPTMIARLAATEQHVHDQVHAPLRDGETYTDRIKALDNDRAHAASLRRLLGLPVDPEQRLRESTARIDHALNAPLRDGESFQDRLEELDTARAADRQLRNELGVTPLPVDPEQRLRESTARNAPEPPTTRTIERPSAAAPTQQPVTVNTLRARAREIIQQQRTQERGREQARTQDRDR